MRPIKAVAMATIKEGIRDKVFLNLLVFGSLLVLASILIGELSIGQREKFMKDIGLASISLIGALTAILLSTGSIRRELERRTIYSMLYRPIRRWKYLLGKYLGVCAVVGLDVFLMSAVFAGVLLLRGYSLHLGLLKAILLTYIGLALIASVGILFSLLASSTLSVLFTGAIYAAGHMSVELKEMGAASKEALTRLLSKAIYYVLPNLGALDVRGEAAYGLPIDNLLVLRLAIYGLAYAGLIVIAASVIFERRELG
mgnify:CR=1 FL=1